MNPDDVVSAILPGLKGYIHSEAESTRAAALAEIDKKGDEATTKAFWGGFVAGLIGGVVGIGIGVAIARRR